MSFIPELFTIMSHTVENKGKIWTLETLKASGLVCEEVIAR